MKQALKDTAAYWRAEASYEVRGPARTCLARETHH
jgi:hypothetical protein